MTDQPEQRDPGARRVDQDDPAPERPEANDVSTTPRVLGGRYEVGELIGRGGMADVHLGHDTRLGRQVAIKMLRSDLARDWFGELFVDHFAATREWEWRQWQDAVTDWELKRYFEII